ncbi:MAG: hypothetical protein ABIY55_25130, partial [Kofleriaceae bacterium]
MIAQPALRGDRLGGSSNGGAAKPSLHGSLTSLGDTIGSRRRCFHLRGWRCGYAWFEDQAFEAARPRA